MLSTPLERLFGALSRLLVDYCGQSSLAGVAYITNRRYHWTERVFWACCTLTAWIWAVVLIRKYVELFRNTTVSIAVESVDIRNENSAFPSVGICELGHVKTTYPRLQELLEALHKDMEYNYDVEDFMLRVVYHNLYNYGVFSALCEMYGECDDDECVRCPADGYRHLSAIVRANCSELFEECRWNGVPFECCRYFHPIQTTLGSCFLLNSVQTVKKYGNHWFPMQVSKDAPEGELLLKFNLASTVHIMNEEDIPQILLQRLQFAINIAGTTSKFFITLQNIANDPEVHTVDLAIRRCRFPDERTDTTYRKYSYSVCITECLKAEQLRMCNCCHHNMLIDPHDNSTLACNYEGLKCLDGYNLVMPPTAVLQPWRTHGLVCRCYPSCTEHDIRVVGKEMYDTDHDERTVLIKLMNLPTQRYRRQIVREAIDVVVSFGGILGLFTGASILSVAEFVYFFTVRFTQHMANDGQNVDESTDHSDSVHEESEENGNDGSIYDSEH